VSGEKDMSNQDREIEARDKQAEIYESWYLQKGVLYDWVEKKTIINALELKTQDIVLDVGCGTGRITLEMAHKCKKIYGIDFSTRSIDILNKKLLKAGIQNVVPFVGDTTQPLQIGDPIDKIASVQVIQHIPSFEKRLETLKSLYKILKPGGICVISLYNFGSIFTRNSKKEGYFDNGIYYYRFTPKEAENFLKESGFRSVTVRGCVNFQWYSSLNSMKFQAIADIDALFSKYKLSSNFGKYLICKGIKL
jgi:ubiquinone/menaquinone biosynthesis C-methylase UbiE